MLICTVHVETATHQIVRTENGTFVAGHTAEKLPFTSTNQMHTQDTHAQMHHGHERIRLTHTRTHADTRANG